MHMFDENEKLKKYDNITDIIDHYISVRRDVYIERKQYQLNVLKEEANLLSNKARFINEILNDEIDLRRKTKEKVVEILTSKKYDKLENDEEYKYLVRLPMDSVTEENYMKLMKEKESKMMELNILSKKDIKSIWLEELDNLLASYQAYKKGKTKKKLKITKK